MTYYIMGNKKKTKFLAIGEEPYLVNHPEEATPFTSIKNLDEEANYYTDGMENLTKKELREESDELKKEDENFIGWTEEQIDKAYNEIKKDKDNMTTFMLNKVIYKTTSVLEEV